MLRSGAELSAKVRMGEPELVEEAGHRGAGLRVMKGKRVALTSTSDLTAAGLERFLEDGDKVKATIFFRGREIAHPEIGRRILERLLDELADVAIAENMPRMEGNTMHVILARKTAGGKPAE